MGEMEKMEKMEKKQPVRTLTEREIVYLSKASPKSRIYVNKLDGCYGGFSYSFDCEYCRVSLQCRSLRQHRIKNADILIGYGWVFREDEQV